jgi:enoyl-CoA hydratase
MELKTLLYEKEQNVAWITLNRPDKLNAQSIGLVADLNTALEDARLDDETHVIVLTGNGRAFSAGADISEFPSSNMMDYIKRNKAIYRPYEFIRDIPKPVIAMVNGIAYGGGCELAMCCDMIIASEEAKFGQPEISIGAIPGWGGTQMLPRLVGEKRAKELVFTGDFIPAEEAFRMGLVNKVVPADKLKDAVLEMIAKLKSKSPAMLAFAKMAVNRSLETFLSTGLQSETDYAALCYCTEDRKEGARAFLEKRPPRYTGK